MNKAAELKQYAITYCLSQSINNSYLEMNSPAESIYPLFQHSLEVIKIYVNTFRVHCITRIQGLNTDYVLFKAVKAVIIILASNTSHPAKVGIFLYEEQALALQDAFTSFNYNE